MGGVGSNVEFMRKLKEILYGLTDRYPEYQDLVRLGDKQAVVNLHKEAEEAIKTLFLELIEHSDDHGMKIKRGDCPECGFNKTRLRKKVSEL